MHWSEIAPADAVDIDLSKRTDIVAPINELGERCPWPWEPQQRVGVPLGQYHCGYCGAMCVAGMPHPDYSGRSFTCPRCGRTSHDPCDAAEGYCGHCHDWTAGPEAEGKETADWLDSFTPDDWHELDDALSDLAQSNPDVRRAEQVYICNLGNCKGAEVDDIIEHRRRVHHLHDDDL